MVVENENRNLYETAYFSKHWFNKMATLYKTYKLTQEVFKNILHIF